VTGLVREPGLVRLPAGSRVADAIEAAGGVTKDGDITGMNLAALLSDGDSVVVGGGPAGGPSGPVTGTVTGTAPGSGSGGRTDTPGAPGGAEAVTTPVNLNQADQAELESLPGVGPVMAGNILAWRDEHGSFTSVEQLQEVSGIGPTRYGQLAPLVTV
jgi:competence protein ComEA